MPDSAETTSTKCFSAILSRMLCSGGLPTHPSEQLIEPSTIKLKIMESGPDENSKRGTTPGVVARLMGLESFPATPTKERTLGDFFRSRSVNSIDFLSHFDPIKHGSRRHRRVRTSVSFGEGINDEYASFVFLFEEELQGEREKQKNGKGVEMERRKSVHGKKVEKQVSGFQKKGMEGEKRANVKERRPVKNKCEGELKMLKRRKIQRGRIAPEVARGESPRKHQPSQNANTKSRSSCSNAAVCNNVEVRPVIAQKNQRQMKINENCCYKKMVEEICMMNEEDVRENCFNYGMDLTLQNFEDFCQFFGQEILEGLLRQFVDDLHCGQ